MDKLAKITLSCPIAGTNRRAQKMSTFRYIPILKWKTGEEGGLSFLSPAQKAGVVPFIILMSEQFKEKKATKNNLAVPAADYFTDRIIAYGEPVLYISMQVTFRAQ
ncbi:hypothetical protein ACFZ8E_21310 [Methylobacterium sp. HMF5984]|jgi:hypothetical protein|uniref:beta family protein n=1 Tax=Methylobacterium sp. HMF5984 TaxID=3367370 RepID=UPI0038542EDD